MKSWNAQVSFFRKKKLIEDQIEDNFRINVHICFDIFTTWKSAFAFESIKREEFNGFPTLKQYSKKNGNK